MGSKQKHTQIGRKATIERRLEERLSFLSKKGTESPAIEKDTLVKKLRADIRAINDRLKAIAANERKTEELAKIKAEKAAAPSKVEEGVKGKKVKEIPLEEGKVKKKKVEKTESLSKDKEGGEAGKPKEASEEGKEKKKKKVKEATEEPTAQAKEDK